MSREFDRMMGLKPVQFDVRTRLSNDFVRRLTVKG